MSAARVTPGITGGAIGDLPQAVSRDDERWVCRLAPPANTLDIPTEAGERLS